MISLLFAAILEATPTPSPTPGTIKLEIRGAETPEMTIARPTPHVYTIRLPRCVDGPVKITIEQETEQK